MDNFEKEYSDIIGQLKNLKMTKPSEKFKAHLMTELTPSLPEFASTVHLPMFAIRLALTTVLLVLLGGAGIVIASETSHPGNLLYPVKRVVEKAKIRLTQSPSHKTVLHLNNADKRIEELKETVKKDGDKEIKNVTSDYQSQVKEAVSEVKKIEPENKDEAVKQAGQRLGEQSKKLQEIQKAVPTNVVPLIQKAIDTSSEEQKALELPKK